MLRSTRPGPPSESVHVGRWWRMLLAGVVAAGLATTGLALAAPAAAEEVPPPEPSTIVISVTDCDTYGGTGNLHYAVHDPNPFYRDFVTVRDAADQPVHEAVYFDEPVFEATDFEADVPLEPGQYTIIYAVEHETGSATISRLEFTVGACPDLNLAVTTSCSTGADGGAAVEFTGLVEGESYAYEVVGPVGSSGTFIATGSDETVVAGELPPGNYYAYVEWRPGDPAIAAPAPMFDWRGFAVEPCQPEIVLEVTECTAGGGTGSVLLTLSNLVAGVEYEVAVTDLGDAEGEPYGGVELVIADESGIAELELAGLPPDHDFTVWVDGVWTTGPWEEPPFIGGGDFTPLETVFLSVAADFGLAPCPVAPVTPAGPSKPAALPATGAGDVTGLAATGLLLLAMGGTVLLSRRGVRRPE